MLGFRRCNPLLLSPATDSSATTPRLKPYANGIGNGIGGGSKLVERVVYFAVSVVLRRKGVLLLAPVVYILGMLYMGSMSIESGGGGGGGRGGGLVNEARVAGSVYRSPAVFENLWPYMANESSIVLSSVWQSELHQVWVPCVNITGSQDGLSLKLTPRMNSKAFCTP